MQGMQYNPGQKTIEAELMEVMTKAGAVSAANAGQFSKVSWQGVPSSRHERTCCQRPYMALVLTLSELSSAQAEFRKRLFALQPGLLLIPHSL